MIEPLLGFSGQSNRSGSGTFWQCAAVRHLDGKLWELRRESNTNIFRLIYAIVPDRKILFLHGFQKKTQKTPRPGLETAQRRLDDYLARAGG